MADAFRGDVKLEVESTAGFVAGSWVRLTLSDPPADSTHSGSLVSHLYGGVSSICPELDVFLTLHHLWMNSGYLDNYLEMGMLFSHEGAIVWHDSHRLDKGRMNKNASSYNRPATGCLTGWSVWCHIVMVIQALLDSFLQCALHMTRNTHAAGFWPGSPPKGPSNQNPIHHFDFPDEDLPDDASERGVKHLPAGRRHAISFVCRVASIGDRHVRLSQPLPLDVRAEWNPELHRFLPTLTHAGIEQLTIAFPQARVHPWECFVLLINSL